MPQLADQVVQAGEMPEAEEEEATLARAEMEATPMTVTMEVPSAVLHRVAIRPTSGRSRARPVIYRAMSFLRELIR